MGVITSLRAERDKLSHHLSMLEEELGRIEGGAALRHNLIDAMVEYFLLVLDRLQRKAKVLTDDVPVAPSDQAGAGPGDFETAYAELKAAIRSLGERLEHLRLGQDVSTDVILDEGGRYVAMVRTHLAREEAWLMLAAERSADAPSQARAGPAHRGIEPDVSADDGEIERLEAAIAAMGAGA